MPQRVVDEFEAVQVHVQHRYQACRRARGIACRRRSSSRDAVRQPGQGIVLRLIASRLVSCRCSTAMDGEIGHGIQQHLSGSVACQDRAGKSPRLQPWPSPARMGTSRAYPLIVRRGAVVSPAAACRTKNVRRIIRATAPG